MVMRWVASILSMTRAPPRSPTTSPVARLVTTSPITVEAGSLMRVTRAAPVPSSVTRPARAPPAPITTSPILRPSSLPASIITTRLTSASSREMTRAATVE